MPLNRPPYRLLAFALIVALGAVLPARADVPAPPLDPAVSAALARVSAAQLRATDERLVGFGTRSTFSEQSGANRGVFAARAYLVNRFREIARSSNGRMTVALDSYT
ncbi:MAG: hypothetical protein QOJ39_7, partial [Candidatus Eremiobacteraeota bacterium]|nr:hypothetical protein [Candidatus Eremiobacteraeota bacterium]